MESEKKWYVIHTYSGYENKVKANLESRVHTMGMEDNIFNVIVPMEEETETKDGRKKTVKKKIFPGYALVEMIVNDRSWYVVRNTPGVTGFVGSGTKPIPLSEAEVKHILKSAGEEEPRPVVNIKLEKGQVVRIVSGAFDGQTATVAEVLPEKGVVKVLVNIFGRETPAELAYNQVEEI
ncbi:transcription termination/antitermination protein NusG [Selenomonas sputigena]|uniref:Transcription termination/antitermination protein NusG n=1 Tax=Selenomonas sputigena TaxID=69823 RepID=A0ABV3X1U5_9FIRM